MKQALALIAAVFLAGCGAVESTKLNVVPVTSTAFSFEDQRPAEGRLTDIKKASYGTMMQLADDRITPPGPALLKTWLSRKLSPQLEGKNVILREFSVTIFDYGTGSEGPSNAQGAAMSSVPGANPASLGLANLLIGGFKSANAYKSVNVKIGGTVGDAEFSAEGHGMVQGYLGQTEVNAAIVKALDNAVDEISQHLAEPASPSVPDGTKSAER